MGAPLLPPVFVNGVEITPEAIAAEAQNHPAPAGKPGLAWRAAAQALALREVLLQEARSRGLRVEPKELSPGQIETEEEAMVRGLIEIEVAPHEPDEDQLHALWQANPDRFRAPDLWEAAHILIAAPPADLAARAKAKALAMTLAAELAQDPKRLADLAQHHSACSSRSNGGLLGQLGSGDTVPEFETALRSLAPGKITPEPVETRFGFHLIRLDAHARGERLPFEAVRPRLKAAASKAHWVQAARAYVADVLGRANVTGL